MGWVADFSFIVPCKSFLRTQLWWVQISSLLKVAFEIFWSCNKYYCIISVGNFHFLQLFGCLCPTLVLYWLFMIIWIMRFNNAATIFFIIKCLYKCYFFPFSFSFKLIEKVCCKSKVKKHSTTCAWTLIFSQKQSAHKQILDFNISSGRNNIMF